MTKVNLKSFDLRTDVECAQKVALVRDCINRSKDAAAEAVAVGYLLERGCRAGFAKLWLLAEIDTRNEEIKEHNKLISELFTLANKYANEKLSKDHWLNQEPADDAEREAQRAKREELDGIGKLEPRDKSRLKKVLIDAREGASRFTRLIKYLFEFDRDYHSGMVSRYSLAFEWVAARFDDNPSVEVDDIKKAIAEADGLEKIIQDQREMNDNTEETKEELDIIQATVREEALSRLATLSAIANLSMDPGTTKDDYGLLLYRKGSTGIDILGDADMPESAISRAVDTLADNLPAPCAPLTEFLGRVVQIGSTVREGYQVNSNAADGSKVTVRRCITIKPDEQGHPQLVISASYADAAPILKAKPKGLEITALPNETLIMRQQNRRRFEKEIISPQIRSLMTLSASADALRADGKPAESEMAWIVDNRALKESKGDDYHPRSIFWRSITEKPTKPIDVEIFRASFGGEVDISDIGLIFEDVLKPWAESKAGDKAKHKLRVSVENDELTVTCGPLLNYATKLQNPIKVAGAVSLRPRDLFDLFLRLLDWKTNKFTIRGDLGGLLQIAWADDFADYEYYLPILNAEGRLETRRICKMMPAVLPIAAE